MSGVYDVFVKISMTNEVSPGLAIISKEVLGLGMSVNSLTKAFNTMSTAGKLALGGTLVASGVGLAVGLKKIADNAKELSHELVQLQKLNISAPQLAAARANAIGVSASTPGTTELDALKFYGAAYSMFGNDGALKMMKPLAEFAQVAGNTSGNFDKAADGIYSMIRAGDLMGKFVDETTHKVDPARLSHFLELGQKAMLISHGKIDAQTWMGLAQQGGPALSGMTDDGLLQMAILAQGMGGPRAGTAWTSLYQQMVGGKMTGNVATELHRLGLVGSFTQKNGAVIWGKESLNTPLAAALKHGTPFDALDTIVSAMEKHGVKGMENQVAELFKILGRQTTQRGIHDLLRNRSQMEGEFSRMKGGMNTPDAATLANSADIEQVEHNLEASWKNLMMAVAGPNAQNYIALMNATTNALNSLTAAVRDLHPETPQNIGVGLAGLSALMTGAGALRIATAFGPGGWFVLGIGALGTAMEVAYQKSRPLFFAMMPLLGALTMVVGETIWFAHVSADLKNPIDALNAGLQSLEGGFNAAIGAIQRFLASLTLGLVGGPPGVNMRSGVGTGVHPGTHSAPTVTAPGKQGSLQINQTINLDGKRLAQNVEHHIVKGNTYPTTTPQSDGFSQPSYG